VTALRAAGRGRVRVELDGEAWRVLPLEPVVRAGLCEGIALDRVRVRALARELRRARALGVAGRALARRDLSEQRLRERLRRAGVARAGSEEAVDTLRRAGLVDDQRFACARAAALAARGLGDAAIRFDLERQGVSTAALEAALNGLEPEGERAADIVSKRGGGSATARYLARRGFGEDAVEAAAQASVAPEG
jgi:SOS response regulatory protein OraA/RecX